MTKKEKIKAGKSAAGTLGPEPFTDDNQGPATSEIDTVEDLEACYPLLVSEIRNEVFQTIGTSTAKEAKENMPELYQRIVMDTQNKSDPNLNVPGFLLEVDDPFADGALRTYQNQKRVAGLRLPHVLPYKDKMTKITLENYIMRANGGGDIRRAQAARKALEKCK